MFVTVSVCVELWPACMFVKVRFVGFAVKVAGVTPAPDNAMSTVVVDPLTVSDRLPLRVAAVVGAKLTLNVEA